MNSAVNEIANAIFKKPLHECSLEELQQLTQQYPYFGPAQLLLAKKISAEEEVDPEMYDEQVQKTSLYFQNRVWLHYLLNDEGNNVSLTDAAPNTEKEMPVIEKEQYEPPEIEAHENKEEEVIHETVSKKNVPIIEEEQNEPTEIVTEENKEEEIIHEPAAKEINKETGTNIEIPVQNTGPGLEISENLNNETEQFKPNTEQNIDRPEMSSLKTESIPDNGGLTFEPYHTVDYFASQGIKFKEEDRPKDRFSMQLKSFTEWLKTMKRIPVAEIATADTGGEQKVEQMAEFSLAERHVITEAMAEVWKKQGNKAKAEEIYRKLSLLDPSKSSYFAAKIEELKKTI